MAYLIEERTVVGGIKVKVKNRRNMGRLFVRLGGKVITGSDKGWTLEFPTQAALDEYTRTAKLNGALFDSVEEN